MIETITEGTVRWLMLARPAAANALNQATCSALADALQQAAQEPAVGAVVLGAAGDRAFCAGADLKEFADLPKAEAAQRRRTLLMDTLYTLLDFPKPLLACVQAPAVGAGAMLALACDEIVMAEHAWLSLPEIRLGMPTPVGAAIVAQRASRPVVQRLVQAGERIDAGQALQAGLVDHVAPAEALRERCATLAQARGAHAGHAYAANKRWINRDLRQHLAKAAEAATLASQIATSPRPQET
ncbi:enoyl-CoA hydratase/isomerase family protein [Bordetella sp. BOR01]|uniref:enoyl-CoA hydratase/isomerase family protein n=1 Tax=Bordetella sp. BOR01 TaxID=2854779 RepID=UPI001C4792D2|nr:enoyl-CoA hydratase/isomerase family protein [Bordetella sp. BOR01]MBV7482170.1 enoyl-CoA hydratase/isomerase family protein [Bordetella sp. BOR01]